MKNKYCIFISIFIFFIIVMGLLVIGYKSSSYFNIRTGKSMRKIYLYDICVYEKTRNTAITPFLIKSLVPECDQRNWVIDSTYCVVCPISPHYQNHGIEDDAIKFAQTLIFLRSAGIDTTTTDILIQLEKYRLTNYKKEKFKLSFHEKLFKKYIETSQQSFFWDKNTNTLNRNGITHLREYAIYSSNCYMLNESNNFSGISQTPENTNRETDEPQSPEDSHLQNQRL